jgi:hypothetical protein
MAFRQFEGLFPMPFWHTSGIPQSWAWTLLAPYLVSCPAGNPRIEWQNFPGLNITNNPNATELAFSSLAGQNTFPAITHNRSDPLSAPGYVLDLSWERKYSWYSPLSSCLTFRYFRRTRQEGQLQLVLHDEHDRRRAQVRRVDLAAERHLHAAVQHQRKHGEDDAARGGHLRQPLDAGGQRHDLRRDH